jgi:ketosteroid isomerase-like protein
MSDEKNENLRAAYQQLCDSYRAIDDFRAKLLGFLPLATGSGIFLLLGPLSDQKTSAQQFMAPVGVFGFVITLGLFFYELYGIKKCHHLIEAGKQIEVRLCIAGQFLNRPREVAGFINEPFAAGVIYPAVLAAWTYLAFHYTKLEADSSRNAIIVLIVGFAVSLTYNLWLKFDPWLRFTHWLKSRKDRALPAKGGRAMTEQDQRNLQNVCLMYTADKAELANVAPDIVWHVPGHNPVCGTYHGFKEYTKLMPIHMEPLTCWNCTLEEVMVNGNYVMTTFRLQGERKDKTIDLRGGDLIRLSDDGKIIEGWSFTDNQDALDEFFSA